MKWEIELHESEVNELFNYYTLWLKTTEELIPIGNFDRLSQISTEIVHAARMTKFDKEKGLIEI